MRIAIMGSSGFVGSYLVPFLESLGNTIIKIKRDRKGNYDFNTDQLENLDAIINLAGASIARRWTKKAKAEIKSSRIEATLALSDALLGLKKPPKVVLNASAIGYYGNRGETSLNEESEPGSDFLAEVVEEWEEALYAPKSRTVFLRFGLILSPIQGALAQMLPIFKLGLGGILGSGRQFMSWIAIEDVLGAINHVLGNEAISGPVNFVAPHPVRNEKFTKTLGNELNRPTFLPVPAFAIKLIFGEMGEELLLSSTKVEPKVLLESKYPFLYPTLEETFKHQLKD